MFSRLLPAPAVLAGISLLVSMGACNDPAAAPDRGAAMVAQGSIRYYGRPVTLGSGIARTYLLVDRQNSERALEVGVALSERATDGLPDGPVASHHPSDMRGGHPPENIQLLDLPEHNPTPYQFIELDWNPLGHEPAGIYDLPHFDFHFYTVSRATRSSILPSDPQFAVKAATLPASELRPPFYLDAATAAGGIPAALVTVPMMGLHWVDVRSPELQLLAGNPAGYRPFTKTLLIGSWDGRFIFNEPMITLAYLLEKRSSNDPAVQDETIPVPTAEDYEPAGFYPAAYRIAYDRVSREFLVGLTQLEWHE